MTPQGRSEDQTPSPRTASAGGLRWAFRAAGCSRYLFVRPLATRIKSRVRRRQGLRSTPRAAVLDGMTLALPGIPDPLRLVFDNPNCEEELRLRNFVYRLMDAPDYFHFSASTPAHPRSGGPGEQVLPASAGNCIPTSRTSPGERERSLEASATSERRLPHAARSSAAEYLLKAPGLEPTKRCPRIARARRGRLDAGRSYAPATPRCRSS